MRPASASPVSFSISVVRLPQKGMPVTVEANEEQRALLAAAHQLTAVDRFQAELLVEWQAGGVRVSGEVRATIVQACIVTLDPVISMIEEPLEQIFLPPDSRLSRITPGSASELVLDAEGPDIPEMLEGDAIDIGALAEEFFALAIDPYPRAPGAELLKPDDGADAAISPFAKLALLTGKTG